MSTPTALATSLVTLLLGCRGRVDGNPGSPPPPRPDQIVQGRALDVRRLLGEVHDARSELALREPAPAAQRVADATAIVARLGTEGSYALLEDDTGTIERRAGAPRASIVKLFDRYAEQQLLDLAATHLDLDRARVLLVDGKLAEAGRRLARIEGSVQVRRMITPDRDALVIENVKTALRDASVGDWRDARIAFRAARRDVAMPPGTPRVEVSTLPPAPVSP